ncbi:MAG: hypothetical protein M3R63_11885 [Actinomycetota bacterium]|nr:hypothetical protein [Actinomycetota bacterium]
MTREDRELLAELARLNSDVPSLAMRMMDGSAEAGEQHDCARRLIALGERLHRRAECGGYVVDGETVIDGEPPRRLPVGRPIRSAASILAG